MGGFDASIEDNIPTFFGMYIRDELIGVNSGFKTGEYEYRSRGLYVKPEYRRKLIATMLLEATQMQAIRENAKMIWSMPRKTAVQTYLSFGFKQSSKFFDENVEFGPNCFVVKYLEDHYG